MRGAQKTIDCILWVDSEETASFVKIRRNKDIGAGNLGSTWQDHNLQNAALGGLRSFL